MRSQKSPLPHLCGRKRRERERETGFLPAPGDDRGEVLEEVPKGDSIGHHVVGIVAKGDWVVVVVVSTEDEAGSVTKKKISQSTYPKDGIMARGNASAWSAQAA